MYIYLLRMGLILNVWLLIKIKGHVTTVHSDTPFHAHVHARTVYI